MNYFKNTASRIFQDTAVRLWAKETTEEETTIPRRMPGVYAKVKIVKQYRGDTKRF